MEKVLYPLNPSQQSVYFSVKYSILKQISTICTSVLTDRALDTNVFKAAIAKSCSRYDCFGMRLCKKDAPEYAPVGVAQYFVPSEEPEVETLDFAGKDLAYQQKELGKYAKKHMTKMNVPLYKVYLIKACDGKTGILLVVSHIVMDSLGISSLFMDVLKVYDAMIAGAELPKAPTSFISELQKELAFPKTPAYMEDMQYWMKEYTPEPLYCAINGNEALYNYRKKAGKEESRCAPSRSLDSRATHLELAVPAELMKKVEGYCEENKISLQIPFMFAEMTYLSKACDGQTDVSMFTVNSRRATLSAKNCGGTRVHFHMFRRIINPDATLGQALHEYNDKELEIFRHFEINPLHTMGLKCKLYNAAMDTSYTTLSFTFQPVRLSTSDGSHLWTKWYENGTAAYPMYITAMDTDGSGALTMIYEYLISSVDEKTVYDMHRHLINTLETITADPDAKVASVLQ